MNKTLLKDSIRQIKNTFKRFLSLVLIVLLGVGFFAGIRATSPDMKDAVDTYFDAQNMMDIQVLSTLGLTDTDIETLSNLEQIEEVEPSYSFDAIVSTEKKDIVVKIQAMPEKLNKLNLLEGKFPESQDECVVEKNLLIGTGYKIGDYITINPEEMDSSILNEEESSDDTQNAGQNVVKNNYVKIVGTVESPEYISTTRGTSKLGAGSVNYYMFIPKTNINMSVYTVAYITVNRAIELKSYNNDYEDLISEAKDKIEEISESRKQARYEEIVNDATEKLDKAQAEYDEEKQKAENEIADAEKKLEEAKQQVADGENELAVNKNKAQVELANAERQISEAESELNSAKTELENNKKQANSQIQEAENQLANLNSVKSQYETLQTQKLELNKQISEIDNILKVLNQDPTTNAERIQELTITKQTLNSSLEQVNSGIQTIETTLNSQGIQASKIDTAISQISTQISTAKNQLIDAENQITESENKLKNSKTELANNRQLTNKQLSDAQNQIDEAKSEIAENEVKLEQAKSEMTEKLADAQLKIDDAREKVSKIEKPNWYILDRNANYGYAEYIQDTDRIGKLAQVFPIVFFLVAALISLTSMSRMIEEQRVQIGTLKALGYNKVQISMKYIVYAFLATAIGGLAGMFIGFKMLPKIIYSMYAIMYTLPGIDCTIRLDIGLAGIAFATVCTIGATIYTCSKELKEKPASLMLPKAPKPGKRIFLERIKFIWSKMKFTQKVTARNIFRYKKKFLMTIVGVAGCTALIIAGFGIRDSISRMIPSQYGEIFKYDAIVTLEDDITTEQIEEQNNQIKSNEKVENTLTCYMKTVEITSIENTQTLNLIVAENVSNLSDFIVLKSRTKNEEYQLTKDEVIISEKIARLLEIKVGDQITIKDTDDLEKQVTVGAITENYIYHYIYMSSDMYNSLYGENQYKPNTILIKQVEQTTLEDEEQMGRKILENNKQVTGISFLSSTKDIFGDVMEKLQLVVYVLIVAAGLLAFAVLYNLSNVNISERIRELATIKVLGFYNKEVFSYVTKETRILTAIGIILGLFGGHFLTMLVIKTCELDMLMFDPRIRVMSYVYGIIITVIFAEIVNIAVNFTLKKISMTESLKSVD